MKLGIDHNFVQYKLGVLEYEFQNCIKVIREEFKKEYGEIKNTLISAVEYSLLQYERYNIYKKNKLFRERFDFTKRYQHNNKYPPILLQKICNPPLYTTTTYTHPDGYSETTIFNEDQVSPFGRGINEEIITIIPLLQKSLSKGGGGRHEGHNGKTHRIPDVFGGSDRSIIYSGPTQPDKRYGSPLIVNNYKPDSGLFGNPTTATIINHGGVVL